MNNKKVDWPKLIKSVLPDCIYISKQKGYLYLSRPLGWEVAGDHIQSGAGSSDNDYLILNIHIPGFK